MRFPIDSSFVPLRRLLRVVPLTVALLIAVPNASSATCWNCAFSDSHPWPSWMCDEVTESFDWGWSDCVELRSSSSTTSCETFGLLCLTIIITAADDQEALTRVMAGEALRAEDAHFFIVDGDDAVLMRKCDLSVVARTPHRDIRGLDAESAIATVSAPEPSPSGWAITAAIASLMRFPWR